MTPFYFGPQSRRLFGLFESAREARHHPKAVLLCNPFGQEAIRTHRMYRVLADRLVRAGISVMRFDYFGTGDSAGDDHEGDLEGWDEDVVAAHEELTRRSGSGEIVWIGARLGATLAVHASHKTPQPPARMILWEPVVDGASYLREMAERHVRQLELSHSPPHPPWQELLDSLLPGLDREGMGFEMGDQLQEQLRAMTPSGMPPPRVAHCALIEQAGRPLDVAEMVRRWLRAGIGLEEIVFAHDFDWMASQALNTALVPSDAVQLLARLASEDK
jgi:pimeloyl-ACP methyl ester carboxylesterase